MPTSSRLRSARGRGCTRIAIAGPDLRARAALFEHLIPGLIASGAELWVQIDARRGDALAARLRSSGLIAPQRVVHVLPARAPPGRRVVLADRECVEPGDDLTLMVIDADDADQLTPAALRQPELLVLDDAADASLLRALGDRRAGRPIVPANLVTGEGIERVLALIADALQVTAAESAKPALPARKRASLWT